MIGSLADKAGGMIEARTLAALVTHVPLAEVGGAIARGTQQSGVGHRIVRDWSVVIDDAVGVVVTPGEERGTTR